MSTTISRDYSQMPIGTVDNDFALGSSNSSPIHVGQAPDGSIAGLASRQSADGKLTRGVILRRLIEGVSLTARLVRIESEVLLESGHSFGLLKAWHGKIGAFIQSYSYADKAGAIHSQVYYYHPPVVELPEGKMITETFDWGFVNDEFTMINAASPKPAGFAPFVADGDWHRYEIRIDTDVITWQIDDNSAVFDVPLVAEAQVYHAVDVWHGNVWTRFCQIEVLDDSEVPHRTAAELAEIARLIKVGNDRRAELERQRVEAARAKRLADRQAEAARIRAEQAAARKAKRQSSGK